MSFDWVSVVNNQVDRNVIGRQDRSSEVPCRGSQAKAISRAGIPSVKPIRPSLRNMTTSIRCAKTLPLVIRHLRDFYHRVKMISASILIPSEGTQMSSCPVCGTIPQEATNRCQKCGANLVHLE